MLMGKAILRAHFRARPRKPIQSAAFFRLMTMVLSSSSKIAVIVVEFLRFKGIVFVDEIEYVARTNFEAAARNRYRCADLNR